MALQNLVDGQCGEGNALMQLTQHINKDKAYVDEGIRWTARPYDRELHSSGTSNQYVEDFLNEFHNEIASSHQGFRMDSLLQEMREIERFQSRIPPSVGPGVADLATESRNWVQEYLTTSDYQNSRPIGVWSNEFFEQQSSTSTDPKWFEEFNSFKMEDHSKNETGINKNTNLENMANEFLKNIDDPKFTHTEFMKFVKNHGSNSKTGSLENWSNEFLTDEQKTKENLKNKTFTEGNAVDKWISEFQNQDDFDSSSLSPKEREDFWSNLQNEWDKISKNEQLGSHPWLSDFDKVENEQFQYRFQENNPLSDHPNPLEEGKKCYKLGDLPSAVLLFEAAAQQMPDNKEVWFLLGKTHAENEQDPSAIAALRKSLKLDPENCEAWMALATSYTNESYQSLACTSLEEWIRHSEYSSLLNGKVEHTDYSSNYVGSLAPRELLEEVQELFIAAANQNVKSVDGKVQTGLGILFSLTGDFDKAIDCFQAALTASPNDALLWNKIGASYANRNMPVEAINAYRTALELMPGFIRCRYNLGIACINIGAKREAIQHFLEALNMQSAGRGPGGTNSSHAISDCIWNTLRNTIFTQGMTDLIDSVDKRDLTRLNAEFDISSNS